MQQARKHYQSWPVSMPSDRVFSAAGNIASQHRASLSDEHVHVFYFNHRQFLILRHAHTRDETVPDSHGEKLIQLVYVVNIFLFLYRSFEIFVFSIFCFCTENTFF